MKHILLAAVLAGLSACTQHRVHVDPIQVEPIHMTVDVNIRVDRQLDSFFEFEDEVTPATPATPATQAPPAPQATPAIPETQTPGGKS